MKRAEMLRCADMEPGRFDILRRRDQLPIIYPTAFSSDMDADFEAVAGHSSTYSLEDAFRLRLMLDLLGGESKEDKYLGGIGPATAATLVSNVLREGDLDLDRHPWVGVAVYEDDGGRWGRWYRGDLSNLPGWLAEEQAQPVRVIVASAARAWATVRGRAKVLGLLEASE